MNTHVDFIHTFLDGEDWFIRILGGRDGKNGGAGNDSAGIDCDGRGYVGTGLGASENRQNKDGGYCRNDEPGLFALRHFFALSLLLTVILKCASAANVGTFN